MFFVFRLELDRLGFIERIVKFDLVERRQFLVGLRREVVPDVTGLGVGPEGAGGVGLDFRQRIALLVGEEIVLEKIRLHDRGAEPGLAFARLRIDSRRRLFARVTTGATLGENLPCRGVMTAFVSRDDRPRRPGASAR